MTEMEKWLFCLSLERDWTVLPRSAKTPCIYFKRLFLKWAKQSPLKLTSPGTYRAIGGSDLPCNGLDERIERLLWSEKSGFSQGIGVSFGIWATSRICDMASWTSFW
jgi:hypothetical protein